MTKRKSMQEIIDSGVQMFAPCVWDAISAKAVEECGFEAVLLSGGAMSTAFGVASEEDLSVDEVIKVTESIAHAVSIPVVVDFGDGHSDSLSSLYRNVKRLAQAGAAAFTLEDSDGEFRWPGPNQELIPFHGKSGVREQKDLNEIMEPFIHPKSMSQIFGRGFRPAMDRESYLERIHTAVEACKGTDCMVIARSEAYDMWGFDEVVGRLKDAQKLGAGMWTVCLGMWKKEEGKAFSDAIGGPAMWPDVVSLDDGPNVSLAEMKEMNFQFVTCHFNEKGAMYGMQKFGKEVFENKSTADIDNLEIEGLSKAEADDVLNMVKE